MERKEYLVVSIDGEYANLKDLESGTVVPVAMFLLPPNTDVGTHLVWENLSYEILS